MLFPWVMSHSQQTEKEPLNIILMVGDVMGLSQITAGMYINNNTFTLKNFSVVGLSKINAIKSLVTDLTAS